MELKKIKLPFKIKKPTLALGSQTKNTVCFAKGNFAYLSPTHSDLNNPQDFLKFEKTVRYFLKKKPKIIAYDLHPEYQSTKYALSTLNITHYTLNSIQHHHAHIVSCMAENGMKNQKVIGVAFDGTGFGTDNALWGAEFLICDYKNFLRKAHLKEIPLLGGEKAILEPWRLASLWLYLAYKDKFLNLGMGFLKGMDKKRWRVLKNMYSSGFNFPLASSMGRLFDAVGSLVFKKYRVNFEAELAIELERIASGYKLEVRSYKFKIIKEKNMYILDPQPMFREIISALKTEEPEEKIAYRFHLTVAEMIRQTCLILRKETKINQIVLSGGVFQNNLLLSLGLDLLYKESFQVFTHKELSCSDSSLALGQVLIANYKD
jgi:hydrogenase maturation protein HypF